MLDKLMNEETALFCGFLETFCSGLHCKDCNERSEDNNDVELIEEEEKNE